MLRDLIIRLPRTATRPKAPSWALLLERVEPHATDAYDFRGKALTPGQTIDELDLWPTENYPAIPVLLETCQICFSGRGHNRNPTEHILWIYKVRAREWRQVARVSAHSQEEWISALLPVALRIVKPRVYPPEPDLHTAARRIVAAVECELLGVPDNAVRSRLLQATHDYMCQRRADLGNTRKLYQMPLRSDDFFAEIGLGTDPENVGWTVRESESTVYVPLRRW